MGQKASVEKEPPKKEARLQFNARILEIT